MVVRPRRSCGQARGDAGLGDGVDGGRRIVQHEHRRVDRQRAGQRDPLALPARQRPPAFGDGGRDAVGQRAGHLVDGGRGHRFVGERPGSEVLGDGAGEQVRVVRGDQHHLAHPARVHSGQIDRVDRHRAGRGVGGAAEAVEQVGRGGRIGGDHAEQLARACFEVDVAQRAPAQRGQPHVPGGRRRQRRFAGVDRGWRVQHVGDPPGRRAALRQLAVDPREDRERRDQVLRRARPRRRGRRR